MVVDPMRSSLPRFSVSPRASAALILWPLRLPRRGPETGMEGGKASSVLFASPVIANDKHDCSQALLAKEAKESSTEKPKKMALVGYDSLPKYLKHNEFILGYYRCEWPLKDAILSVFSIHNETVNVWSHLIGFFLFLVLTLYAANMVPTIVETLSAKQPYSGIESNVSSATIATGFVKVYEDTNASSHEALTRALNRASLGEFVARLSATNGTDASAVRSGDDFTSAPLGEPITRWPFFAFLCGAMFCLLTSSACHLLSCHSEHTSYVMLHLDYAGISTLIVTSIIPQIYYTFSYDPFYRNVYTAGIIALGMLTILISLVPVFETPEFRFVRSLVFVLTALYGWGPITHKLMIYGARPEALVTTLYEFLMNCCYGIGVVIYAMRIPERWMPGKFDLIGHSHQLFHLLVIAGAYIQYLAILVYLQWRDTEAF